MEPIEEKHEGETESGEDHERIEEEVEIRLTVPESEQKDRETKITRKKLLKGSKKTTLKTPAVEFRNRLGSAPGAILFIF